MSRTFQFFAPFSRSKRDRQSIITHTFLNGGSFVVPNDEVTQARMFEAIAADLRAGQPMFINEIASEVFRMYLDLDLQHETMLADDELDELVAHVTATFRRFYPENASRVQPDLFTAIVTEAQPHALCANRGELEALLHVVPLGATVRVRDGRLWHAEAEVAIAWRTAPAADGEYVTVEWSDELALGLAGDAESAASHAFEAPSPSLALEETSDPGALLVRTELARFGEWRATAATHFRLDDGRGFQNVRRDASGCLKHGVHVLFPKLRVDIEAALVMREALIDRLTVSYGTRYAPKGFADAVDHAVYGHGKGLRMYGSHKTVECTACGGRKRRRDDGVHCTLCHNGKRDAGRPHLLRSVCVDGERRRDLEAAYAGVANVVRVLRATSIRTWEPKTPGWACFVGCPRVGDMVRRTTDRDGGAVVTVVNDGRPLFRESAALRKLRTDARTVEVTDPRVVEVFERNIKRWSQYRKLRVAQVRYVARRDNHGAPSFYFVDVEGEGKHYCLNKKPPSEHASSTIYFQATNKGERRGLVVRCRCPKPSDEGRWCGPCPQFASTPKPLSTNDNAILFAQTAGADSSALPFDMASRVVEATTR